MLRATTSPPPLLTRPHPALRRRPAAERCNSFEDCIAWARRKFQQQFYDRIAQVRFFSRGAKGGRLVYVCVVVVRCVWGVGGGGGGGGGVPSEVRAER